MISKVLDINIVGVMLDNIKKTSELKWNLYSGVQRSYKRLMEDCNAYYYKNLRKEATKIFKAIDKVFEKHKFDNEFEIICKYDFDKDCKLVFERDKTLTKEYHLTFVELS